MENQPPTKRREFGSMDEDMISQLPLPILQNHILSLLPQKDAFRTCVLSKSWRHLGSTLPKFEFHRSSFVEVEKFLSVVANTLQRYVDEKLSIREFILDMMRTDCDSNDSISLLDKWIPRVIVNMGVKTFKLTGPSSFSLPSVVFQAEYLTELHLEFSKLDQINSCIVNLQALKCLSLDSLCVENDTFEKIMCGCPLIEHLVLFYCWGLSTIKLNKARNLKHLSFTNSNGINSHDSIQTNNAPHLETIRIDRCLNWNHLDNNYFFPRLKSLYLCHVRLPTKFLNILSLNCPCLEVLELHYCPALIRESKISNLSIERLVIWTSEHPFKAAIDVPNMIYFEFRSKQIPSISFATSSREWESLIHVGKMDSFAERKSESNFHEGAYFDPYADVLSPWPLKLHEFLKALSQSKISVNIYRLPLTNQDTYDGGSCDPVVVEHMCLMEYYTSHELPALLNCLFHTFRPRYIRLSDSLPINMYESQFWEILLKKRGTSQFGFGKQDLEESRKKVGRRQFDFWKQDLEESSIEVSDKNTNAWHPVHDLEESGTQISNAWHPFQERALMKSYNQSIRFRLKWRDLS